MAQIGECVRRVLLLRLRGVTLVVCLVWRLFAVVEEHHSLRPRNAAAMLGVTLPARKPGSRHCSSSDKNDRPEPTQIWASRRRRPPPMTTRRPVAILAAAVAAGAAAVAHGSVIGVAPADMARYAGASGTFTCADGSATVPLDHVNDDYCDCHDGSDEPGTSACSAGRFYCENRGYFGAHIFSSRVRDGLCDCCDGSDEATHPTQRCPNTCASLAAAALKDYESKEAGLRAALEQKRAWVDASREGATKDQTELVELESSLEQLSTELSNVTARLDVLEEAERARKAAEEARRKEEEEARRQEEEARRAAEQPEGELAEHDAAQPDEGGAAEGGDGAAAGSGDTPRAEPPADGAGPDSAAEGGAGPTADAAADTAADDGTAADGGEESWRQSWMRVDPSEDDRPSADGAAGAAAEQPAAGAGEGEGGGGGEGEGEGDYMPAYDDEEDYVPPEYEGDDDYMPPEYDDDDVPSPHEGDDYPAEYDDDEYGGQYEGDDDLGAGDDDLGAGDDEAERDAYAGDDDYFSPEPEDDDDDYDPYADDEGADDLDEDDGAPTGERALTRGRAPCAPKRGTAPGLARTAHAESCARTHAWARTEGGGGGGCGRRGLCRWRQRALEMAARARSPRGAARLLARARAPGAAERTHGARTRVPPSRRGGRTPRARCRCFSAPPLVAGCHLVAPLASLGTASAPPSAQGASSLLSTASRWAQRAVPGLFHRLRVMYLKAAGGDLGGTRGVGAASPADRRSAASARRAAARPAAACRARVLGGHAHAAPAAAAAGRRGAARRSPPLGRGRSRGCTGLARPPVPTCHGSTRACARRPSPRAPPLLRATPTARAQSSRVCVRRAGV